MTDHSKLRPSQLANKLETAQKATGKAADRIFALALRGDERFSQICARLGNGHTVVAAWRAKVILMTDLESECRRRFGPDAVSHASLWVTALRTRLAARKVR